MRAHIDAILGYQWIKYNEASTLSLSESILDCDSILEHFSAKKQRYH